MKLLGSRWFKLTVGAAAALLLTGMGIFVAFVLTFGFDTNTSQRVAGGGTKVVSVTLTDFDVTPGTLVVDSGTHLILDVVNRGDKVHDLAVDGGVHSGMLSSGDSQRLDFGVVSERVDMVCTRPLHEVLGMKLQIRVVQPAGETAVGRVWDSTTVGGS